MEHCNFERDEDRHRIMARVLHIRVEAEISGWHCCSGSLGSRPTVSDHFMQRIRKFPNLFQLVAAKQVNVFGVVPQVETHVPFPARRIIARQDRDAAVDRALQRFAPFQPRARERGAGAAESGVRHAPVHEGRAPGNLVVVADQVRLVVVFDDARVDAARRVAADAEFGQRDRHPGWVGGFHFALRVR